MIVILIIYFILPLAFEAVRRVLDGQKSYALYSKDNSNLHFVQSGLGIIGQLNTMLIPLLVFSLRFNLFLSLILSFFAAYGASIIGNYYFQKGINDAFNLPTPDPFEESTWELGIHDIPKLWYGNRRRIQRQTGVALILATFFIFLFMGL